MSIFLNILFLLLGMVFLVKGADFFVKGASALARKFKVPSIFIGLTIVALGTSLPELSVSITSAISGSTDMAVGNIIGANLMNMLFILGIVAMFKPVIMNKSTNKIDFPFLIAITGMLTLFSLDSILDGTEVSILSRIESIVLMVILILYLTILIFNANRTRKRKLKQEAYLKSNGMFDSSLVESQESEKQYKFWQILLYILIGGGLVVFGGECVATTAEFLAIQMGMSEALVGITVVSFGTATPELVTSVVAARKGENDLALGNVVGSCIINIAMILGSVGLIAQAPISSNIIIDMVMLFVATIALVVCCIQRKKISKGEGAFLLCLYIAYLTFAIVRNYAF